MDKYPDHPGHTVQPYSWRAFFIGFASVFGFAFWTVAGLLFVGGAIVGIGIAAYFYFVQPVVTAL